jgi:sulfur carrier protein ThiS
MKINVKLFGTLPLRFPDYNSANGLEVEIPDGARVGDLLAYLDISASDSGFVAVDNQVVQLDDELNPGALVRVFQRAFGG